MKTEKKAEAIVLRETGHSMKEIAELLEVAKSTVSLWTRHVDMNGKPESKARLRNRTHVSYQNNARRLAEVARERRLKNQHCGIERIYSQPLSLFSIGCALYWCEGHKGRNVIDFSNSDPAVITVFLRFLRICLNVEDKDIRLRIYAYLNNGITQEEIENHWLSIAGLNRTNLHKGTFDKHSKVSTQRKRNLLYGTAHVSVCSTEKLHTLYGGIAALCGEPYKFLD